MKGRAQFVGAAGQYYVAYCLTVRGYHAAITARNVPDVDILVSSVDGQKLLSVQVKTSRNAYRSKRYGYEVCEWDVGSSSAGKAIDNLWYAFVDLRESSDSSPHVFSPHVFLVPSAWVGAFVQEDNTRKMYLLRSTLWPECEDRWDRIGKFLSADIETIKWCASVPEESKPWTAPGV